MERPHEPIALTAVDVARILKCSRRQVQLMAQRGEIPCRKVGKLLRFHPGVLQDWLSGDKAD